jgi:hypothetical protein
MPTDSDPSKSDSSSPNVEGIRYYLLGSWRNLAHLFTDENISNALLKVISPDKLDSNGNYMPSMRYFLTWSYNHALNQDIKPDLHLVKEEIVRAAAAATDVN